MAKILRDSGDSMTVRDGEAFGGSGVGVGTGAGGVGVGVAAGPGEATLFVRAVSACSRRS